MSIFRLFGRAFTLWFLRDADQNAAALAYFTPFALTPLIIVSISIVGIFVGSDRVVAMLLRWGNTVDAGVSDLIYSSVQNFDTVSGYYYVPVIGVIFLSLVVYIALNSLMIGFHKIWQVQPSGWRSFIQRLWRITVFIVVIQLYLISIIILGEFIWYVDRTIPLPIWGFVSFAASFLLTMMLLAIGYGLLSLKSPSFKGRFAGAMVAGLLLLFSRELVALHFSTSPVQSLFGAAGLLISLLVWVYVAAGIILYGAAFAKVYDEERQKNRSLP